jgi:hypothetical protein
MDDPLVDDPPSDPPKPASTGFRGKRAKKNHLHQKKRKRARSAPTTAAAQEALAPIEPAQEVMPRAIRQRLETKGAKKKASNSELESTSACH